MDIIRRRRLPILSWELLKVAMRDSFVLPY